MFEKVIKGQVTAPADLAVFRRHSERCQSKLLSGSTGFLPVVQDRRSQAFPVAPATEYPPTSVSLSWLRPSQRPNEGVLRHDEVWVCVVNGLVKMSFRRSRSLLCF